MFSLSLQWLVLALDTSLKAALLALLAAAALRAMKLRDSNVRHRVWTGVLLGMLLLPVLARMIPALRLPLPFKLDRLTTFQLEDLDSLPLADTAATPHSTAETPASITDSLTDQSNNLTAARPQDQTGPSHDFPWSRSNAFRPRNNPGVFPTEQFASADSPLPATDSAPAAIANQQPPTPAAPQQRQRPISLRVIAAIAVVWLIGSAALLLRLSIGLLLAYRLVRHSKSTNDERIPSSVRECPLICAPLTVGLIRPHVLLPLAWRTWSPPQLSAVLAHEQMHIERGDCFVLLLAQINRCLYWFHPLAWWLPQHLASLAEAACDDAVIGSTGDRTAYARHLLDVAAAASLHGGRLAPLGVSMARRCEVETRIHAILDFRRPLSQRLSWTTAILLAAAIVPLIALAAALQPSNGEQEKLTPSASKESAVTDKKDASSTQFDAPHPASKSPFTVTGSIVNAQGQPIPGASIHIVPQFAWLESSKKRSPRLVTKSDHAGRFEFTPQPEEADKSSGAKLLIVAPDYGPEFLPLAEVVEQQSIKIALTADDTPIRGHILTLEGQPVADAKITVNSIGALKSGDLKNYIDIVKAGNGANFNFDKNLYQPPHIEPTTTDADGRFEINGIGPNRVAELDVVSRTIQHALLKVMTVESEPLKPRLGRGFYDLEQSRPPVFGATFDWVAKPGRIITGTVVDAKTRQPIAGAGVGSLGEGHAKTDENGRFELLGCAKASSYGLLLGANDQQYINGSARVVDTPGFEPIEVTLELTRGTTVSGRVIDQSTQKPIDHARLTYFPLSPNACVVPGIGGSEARASGAFTQSFTSASGEFSIAVLPGPGFIGISAPKSVNYQPATVDAAAFFKKENVPYAVDAPQGLGKSLLIAIPNGGQSAIPAGQFNWVELLNAPDQPELKLTNDIQLIAAENLAGTVLGPDGKPLSGATVFGLASRFDRAEQTLHTNDFTVTRLAPDEKRTLIFRHDAQKLAGQLEISADSPQPAHVTLQPWSEVTGRLLDKDGTPIANLEIGPWGEVKDGETRGHLPGHTATDDQGRFRLTALVPGLVYSLTAHNTTRPPHVRIRLKPGEILDLGDIKSAHEHLSALPPADSMPAVAMKASPPAPASLVTTSNNTTPADPAQDTDHAAPFRGRVLSASGKPIAGAKIHWIRWQTSDPAPKPPRLLATTNDAGEFSFPLPKSGADDSNDPLGWNAYYRLAVTAPGHGFVLTSSEELLRNQTAPPGLLGTLVKAVTGNGAPVIKLPAAGESIRGRLVNIDGQPMAGVTVKIRWFDEMRPAGFSGRVPNAKTDKQAAWLERVNQLLNAIEPVQLRDVLPQATTDANGEFELRDLGPNRMFQLLVQGEQSESVDIVVRNQSGENITVPPQPNFREHEVVAYHREFVRVIGPSKPFVGRVLDFETGQPISGAVVRAYAVHGINLHSSREREEFATRTDADGRYKITGLPIGKDNRLVAFTLDDVPYMPAGCVADTTKADGKSHDFRLRRGVWATGRVYEAETDKPFIGQIEYYWFRDRELEKQYPGLFFALVDELYWTSAKGEFRVPVLPSRGILAFRYSSRSADRQGIDRFPRGSGAESIEGSEPIGSLRHFPTLPHYLMPSNYERVAEVNPQPGQPTVRVDLPLFASQPVRIRVVDAEGNAVTGCEIYGANQRWGWQQKSEAEFVVEDLPPKEQRKVLAFHRQRNLAGGVVVKHVDAQPLVISLAPAGSITGRLVDDAGEPITDATLHSDYDKLLNDAATGVWANHPRLYANPTNIPVDEQGRFQVDGLIPGWTYTAHAVAPRKLNGQLINNYSIGRVFTNVRIEPGETKNLGDLRAKEGGADEKKSKKPGPANAPAAAEDTAYTYAGTVIDPTGKPVAGAKLHLCYYTREATIDLTALAVTAADGTFKFSRSRSDFDQHAEDGQAWRVGVLVATADGFGFAAMPSVIFETSGRLKAELPAEWRKAIDERLGDQKSILRLVSDVPVKGRIVNVEGQPVSGAKLTVLEISAPQDDGTLDDWEKAAGQPKATTFELQRLLDFLINGPRAAVAFNITPSDADGWLAIRGLGKDRLAKVQLRGSTVEASNFYVRTRPGQTFKLFAEPNERMGEETYYPSNFTHVAGPSQPVIGQVTDAETGQPVPHCLIEGKLSRIGSGGFQVNEIGKIHTVTDAAGRYRLEGLQQTAKYPPFLNNVQILPPHGSPYLPSAAQVKIGLAADPVTHDVKLRRGVVVRGRALDSRTGQPVLGSVHYRAFPDNPAAKSAPDFGAAHIDDFHYQTDAQGHFEIPVLSGKGVLSFAAMDHRDYPHGVGFEEVQAAAGPAANQNFALLSLRHHQALKLLDLAPDAKEATLDFLLRSAGTLTARVLSPTGQLQKKYLIYGATPEGGWINHEGDSFDVKVYEPAQGRRLLIAEPEQNLIAIQQLNGPIKDPFDIKLAPAAIIKGRIIDADGQPLENITVTNPGIPLSSPAMMGPPKPAPVDRGVLPSNIDPRKYQTDKDGRFELRGIIPGLKYTADCQGPGKIGNSTINTFLGRLFTDITTEPGQTLDLGDLKIQSFAPPKQQASGAPAKSEPEKPQSAVAAQAKSLPAQGAPNTGTLRGRVVAANGKPIADAKIFWFQSRHPDPTPLPAQLVATTNPTGDFSFEMPKVSAVDPNEKPSRSPQDRLVVMAAGHGFVLSSPQELRGQFKSAAAAFKNTALKNEVEPFPDGAIRVIMLPPAGESIRGRLVNIDGQPLAGITVKIRWFQDIRESVARLGDAPASKDEKTVWWADRVNSLLRIIEPEQLRDVLPTTTTDAAGRFELRDLGANRLFQLLVQSDQAESKDLVVRNQPGEAITIPPDRGSHEKELVLHPREFVAALAPSQLTTGRVVDRDTGEPIEGAEIRVYKTNAVAHFSWSGASKEFTTRTDAQGRYRIPGLTGNNNRLVVFATGEVPYIPISRAADMRDDELMGRDFRLQRGIWATGRVYDAQTDQPLFGEINYFWFGDGNLQQEPGFYYAHVEQLYRTNDKGEFRVPILPTRGVLAFHFPWAIPIQDGLDRFPDAAGVETIDGHEKINPLHSFMTLPTNLVAMNYQRLVQVKPEAGQTTIHVDMPLVPSAPVKVRVVTAGDQPLNGYEVNGTTSGGLWSSDHSPEFAIDGLAKGERRKVLVFHRQQNLAGGAVVKQDDAQPVEIKLAPAGSVTGRLVDENGEPITDGLLHVDYDKFVHENTAGIWANDPNVRSNPTQVPTDDKGRFQLDGLVPGWTYSAYVTAPKRFIGKSVPTFTIGDAFADVRIAPGEKKDLGNIRVQKATENKKQIANSAPAPARAATTKAQAASVTLTGSVLLPSGQPAPSAHVAVIGWPFQKQEGVENARRAEIIASGKTDDTGHFQLQLKNVSSKTHDHVNLIARGDATAIFWQKLNLDAPPKDLTLNLQPEVPVRIRLIDLEGQPAAGARLKVGTVMKRITGKWLEDGRCFGGENPHPAWIAPLTTDQDGRVTIRGLAADQGAWLHLEGSDRFAQQGISLNTGMPEERGERDATYRDLVRNVKPGEEGLIPLSPAKIFEGTVRYEDTGEPAPHAKVSIWASQQSNFGSMTSVEGKTDDAGHYRISVNPGIRFGVMAYAPTGTSYLIRRTTEDIRWENGDRVRQVDVSLPPGVLVRGKVLAAGTHEPIADAAIQFIPQSPGNRPQLQGVVTGWQGTQHSAKDGSFEIAIPPVPGHLLVNHDQGSYVLQEIGSSFLYNGKPGGQRNYVHALQKIDPAPDAKSLELNIELQPGATISGRIVDLQGQPVEDAVVISRLNIFSFWLSWHGQPRETIAGRFEVKGVKDGVEYPTHFLDPKRRLGATVNLSANDKQPTITLEPCGSATARFVDEKGQPLADHHPNFDFVVTPNGPHRYDSPPRQSGQLSADADHAANVDRLNHGDLKTDAEGKLTIPALIPGATYAFNFASKGRWKVLKQFQVQSGETLDLGDIVQPSPESKSARTSSSTTTKPDTLLARSASEGNASSTDKSGEVSVTGSVLLPTGQPAPAARIFVVRSIRAEHGGQIISKEIVARATTATDGKFQISVAPAPARALGDARIENRTLQLVAFAPGHGLAWEPVLPTTIAKPITLQLVPDSVPLEGRILNLEGQPVAGAHLRVSEILEPDAAALDNWLAATAKRPPTAPTRMTRATSFMQPDRNSTPFPGGKVIHPPALPELPEVTTDPDGRFRLQGLGSNRKITLVMEGATVATSWIVALTRAITPVPMTYADPRYRIPHIFAAKFDFPAEPSQIVEGTVRDVDARTPLAGVTVHVRRLGGSTFMVDGFASAVTDAAGRYRLTGLPKPPAGESDALMVVPDKSQPYFRTEIDVPAAAGLGPVTRDIDLKAAVWLSGRVTDKQTGSGVAAVVSYYPYLDNPHAPKYPKFDAGIQSIGQDDLVATDAAGRFRLPALPGRGVLLATALDGRQYRIADGAAAAGFPSRTSTEQRRTVYHLFSPDVANSVRAVEIDPAVTESSADIELVPLARATMNVLDDKQQPLAGARVIGVYPASAHNTTEQFGTAQPLTGDTADIFGLDLDGRRLVLLLHSERRLAKAVLAEDQKSAVAQLEPCATISGRLLDAQGKPIANQRLSARVAEADSPKPKDNRAWGHIPFFVQSQTSDAEGKFKLDLIVPSVGYRLESAGGIARDIPAVAPGQTIDLGALTAPSPQEK